MPAERSSPRTFSASNFSNTIGQNYRWRTYFHGGPDDLVTEESNGPKYGNPESPLPQIHLSAAFLSKATNRWKVAISAPVRDKDTQDVLAVVALTVDIRVFIHFEDNSDKFFATLVDGRPGQRRGLVLQHPIYEELGQGERLPDRFVEYRVGVFDDGDDSHPDSTPSPDGAQQRPEARVVTDPFGKESEKYSRPWLAAQARVNQNLAQGPRDTGLVIQMQQDYDSLVMPVRQMSQAFLKQGLLAAAAFAAVVASLWLIVLRVSRSPSATMIRPSGATMRPTPVHDLTTLYDRKRDDRS